MPRIISELLFTISADAHISVFWTAGLKTPLRGFAFKNNQANRGA
jgi:hypothetical protein